MFLRIKSLVLTAEHNAQYAIWKIIILALTFFRYLMRQVRYKCKRLHKAFNYVTSVQRKIEQSWSGLWYNRREWSEKKIRFLEPNNEKCL